MFITSVISPWHLHENRRCGMSHLPTSTEFSSKAPQKSNSSGSERGKSCKPGNPECGKNLEKFQATKFLPHRDAFQVLRHQPTFSAFGWLFLKPNWTRFANDSTTVASGPTRSLTLPPTPYPILAVLHHPPRRAPQTKNIPVDFNENEESRPIQHWQDNQAGRWMATPVYLDTPDTFRSLLPTPQFDTIWTKEHELRLQRDWKNHTLRKALLHSRSHEFAGHALQQPAVALEERTLWENTCFYFDDRTEIPGIYKNTVTRHIPTPNNSPASFKGHHPSVEDQYQSRDDIPSIYANTASHGTPNVPTHPHTIVSPQHINVSDVSSSSGTPSGQFTPLSGSSVTSGSEGIRSIKSSNHQQSHLTTGSSSQHSNYLYPPAYQQHLRQPATNTQHQALDPTSDSKPEPKHSSKPKVMTVAPGLNPLNEVEFGSR
ncbi:hypothetical protein QBC38DRAFT_504492 [Podospora fimiseda]|uniref:Uncharacterized protein n=1 Tax=Podospora fimiseda TaxID=252190 RepID=A0AAN6YQ71_9PEZI|nr:hypothetical protein QBC38DRAFT_504492 [Podospora fimiseda]